MIKPGDLLPMRVTESRWDGSYVRHEVQARVIRIREDGRVEVEWDDPEAGIRAIGFRTSDGRLEGDPP